jgi:metallo-beta-lactamase family protein
LQSGSDAEKLAIMRALQGKLSELGVPLSPPHRATPITPVETQAFDE